MATRSVPQPPFSPELLADLHAGNTPPELGAELWPAVRRDAQALRYLHALDDVSTELRALGRDDRVIHPMPADVLDRLERFVEQLDFTEGPTERVATVHQLPLPDSEPEFSDEPTVSVTPTPAIPDRLSRRRDRRPWFIAAAAVAAVAVIASAAIVAGTVRDREVAPTAGPQPGTSQPQGQDLTAAAALSALGRNDVTGPLSSQAALNRCVHATGLDRAVLGSTNWSYRGQDAVLILLTGPSPHKITAIVVGTGCTTGDPQILTTVDIG